MNNVFFFTDIHGHYQLFKTIINYCKDIDKNCLIIFGGDAADRRPDGYKIIKELLADPQIIYLYGNHEDLFVKAAQALIKEGKWYHYLNDSTKLTKWLFNHQETDVIMHMGNEGYSTLSSWILDEANPEVIQKLSQLPRIYSYNEYDFCHAGSTYKIFLDAMQYINRPLPKYLEECLIWDRNAIPLGWEKDRICVFGHTPTLHLPAVIYGRDKSLQNIHPCAWKELMGAKNKRAGWKLDLDTGAYATNIAYVFNCTTRTIIRFDAQKELKVNSYSIDFN